MTFKKLFHGFLILFLIFFVRAGVVFADPPNSPYLLGETLAPTCEPGSSNCTVEASAASGANNDITSLNNLTTPLYVSEGGTGISSYALGDTLYASGTTTLSKLAIGGVGQILSVVGGFPAWVSPSSLDDDFFFSTSSAAYFLSQNQGQAFSTSSALYWLSQQNTNDLAEGTSSLYFTNQRLDDAVASLLQTGPGINLAYNSTAHTLMLSSTGGTGGGTDVNWNYFNGLLRPATSTSQVVIGGTSTSTLSKLQVFGGAFFDAATSTSLAASNLTIGSLSGIVRATGGIISAGLVNLGTDVSGVLSIADGGTGTSTAPFLGALLVGNGNGSYSQTATSSLGLLTTNVAEGTNLYYTNARVQSYLSSTTNVNTANLTVGSLSGLLKATGGLVSSALADVDYQSPISVLYPLIKSGDALSLAFGTTTPNIWSGLQQFNGGASSTALSVNGNANVGSLAIGSLNGILRSTAGVVSSSLVSLTSDITGTLGIANGGTGTTTLTGLLKGTGTSALQSAIVGVDYLAPGSLSAVAPLTYNAASGMFSLTQSSSTQGGYLGSADWNAFNNKISSSSLSATNGITYNQTTGVFALVAGALTSTTSANSWSSLQQFNGGASTTALSASGNITAGSLTTSGNANMNSLTIGSLTGVLHAVSGVISASLVSLTSDVTGTLGIANGGTGSTTLAGLLKGNGSALATAIAGVDYLAPGSLSAINGITYNSTTGIFALASGTLTSTTTTNAWSGLQQFNGGASTTALSASGNATLGSVTTNGNANVGSLNIGSLNGVLHATAGAITASLVSLSSDVTGTLAAVNGGTGLSSYAQNGLLYANTNTSLSQVATSSGGAILETSYSTGAPVWTATSSLGINFNSIVGTVSNAELPISINVSSASSTNLTVSNALTIGSSSGLLRATNGVVSTGLANLSTDVNGLLSVGNGGTGLGSVVPGALLYGNGTGALATTSAATAGQILSYLNNVPTWVSTTTFGGPLTYSNGAVSIVNGAISNAFLANSSLTVSAGAGLTGGGSVSLGGTSTLSLNTANANTWTGLQQFQAGASTSALSVFGTASFGGTATSSFNSNGGLTLAGPLTLPGGITGVLQAVNGIVSATSTIGAAYGGTGISSYTPNSLLYASTNVSLDQISPSSSGTILETSFSNGAPTWVATSSLGINFSNITGTVSSSQLPASQTISGGSINNVSIGASIASTGVFTNSTTTNATTTNLIISNALTIGSSSGLLRTTAGVVSSGLANLGSDVTGTLLPSHGGTGWVNIQAGALLYGNGTGALATTSIGIGGQTLSWLNGLPTWTATTTFSGALSFLNGNVSIGNSSITNSLLANPSFTLSAGSGLTGGSVITLGGTGTLSLDTTSANIWTGLQQFQAGASTTLLSVYNGALFGGTATSSFNSAGALTLGGIGSNLILSLNSAGKVVATSTPTFASIIATSTSATSTIAGGLSVGTNALVVLQNGNVGIGTASPTNTLSVGGIVSASGGFLGTCFNGSLVGLLTLTCNQDVAESYPTYEATEAGDVVAIPPSAQQSSSASTVVEIGKSHGAAGETVLGVVSSDPGLVFNYGSTELAGPKAKYVSATSTVVALSGRVLVKVSAENGAIAAGDELAASADLPGVAVRANGMGRVIGEALQSYSGSGSTTTTTADGTSEILVFINPHWSFGNILPPSVVTDSTSTSIIDTSGTLPLRQMLAQVGIFMQDGVATFQQIFAQKVQTQDLCVGDTCVTPDEFKAMVNQWQATQPAMETLPVDTGSSQEDQESTGSVSSSTSSAALAVPPTPDTSTSSATSEAPVPVAPTPATAPIPSAPSSQEAAPVSPAPSTTSTPSAGASSGS